MVLRLGHKGIEIAVAGSAHPERAHQANEALITVRLPARGRWIEGCVLIRNGGWPGWLLSVRHQRSRSTILLIASSRSTRGFSVGPGIARSIWARSAPTRPQAGRAAWSAAELLTQDRAQNVGIVVRPRRNPGSRLDLAPARALRQIALARECGDDRVHLEILRDGLRTII